MIGNMIYDFIEIGTCDFDTMLQQCDDTSIGLSIEPISQYLANLPTKIGVKKVNAALSDTDGTIDIYYIKDSVIKEHDLPGWMRGCNSVGQPHPYLVEYFGMNLYNSLVTIDTVKTITWKTLVEKYDIGKIKCLKIDTEGHEAIILENYLELCKKYPELYADIIIFEYNYNSNAKLIDDLLMEFDEKYTYERVDDDIILNKREILYI